MKVIGLTGGIGVGKSTVSEYLSEKGYMILDADKISHDITEKGSPVLKNIRDVFGDDIIFEDGSLNRKALADIIFSNKEMKLKLEKMTTDVVLDIIENKLNDLRNSGNYGIIFIDAPLLFETGADKLTDLVWLVDAELDVRIKRVMTRDNATYEEVKQRINHQMSSAEKCSKSDEIIDNSNGKEVLYKQVEDLLIKYDRKTKGKKFI